MLKKIVARLLGYNLWANERLTTWLLNLDHEVLYEFTPSSFGTIDRTLQHIHSAQAFWNLVLTNQPVNEFNLPARDHAVDEVIANVNATSKQLIDTCSAFTEQQLTEHINAPDSRQSRYEYILHVVNHSTYHRGQIVTLCRASGIKGEIPVTDYDGFLWCIEHHRS
jgi:uncharacterized damage-inducible protein DinB